MLLHKWIHTHDNQHGAIFVLFAVTFLFLMAFSAIAVDMGTVYVHKKQLQNAADAAALAGAAKLEVDHATAEATAKNYVTYNGENAQDITEFNYPSATKFNVVMRKNVPLFFMKYFGFSTMQVSVQATAEYSAGTVTPSTTPLAKAIIAGGESDDSINIKNNNISINGDVRTNGKIHLDNTGKSSKNTLNGTLTGYDKHTPIWSQPAPDGNNYYTFAGNYNYDSISYDSNFYDINYKTSNDDSIKAIGNYLDNITNSTLRTPTTNWLDDQNEYQGNNISITPAENQWTAPTVNSCLGPQVYYTSRDLNLQMGQPETAYGIPQSILINGQHTSTPYRYNVVIANGNINASNFSDNNSKNPLIIVSLTGNIDFHDTKAFYGILYAPNGTITLDQNNSVNGSVIGKKIVINNSTKVTFQSFANVDDGSGTTSVFSIFSGSTSSSGSQTATSSNVYLVSDTD